MTSLLILRRSKYSLEHCTFLKHPHSVFFRWGEGPLAVLRVFVDFNLNVLVSDTNSEVVLLLLRTLFRFISRHIYAEISSEMDIYFVFFPIADNFNL